MTRLCILFIAISIIILGCISAPLIKKDELFSARHGQYMGSEKGFHHFIIPEDETVFYRHVRISSKEYAIDVEMPYTVDKEKWRKIEFPLQIIRNE